jgi:hypothetical protein
MYYTGGKAGQDIGYANGYQSARDEKASVAWANTQEGRLAYRFAQSGALDQVAGCKAKGWTIEKNNCYPNAMKDGSLNGWKMP